MSDFNSTHNRAVWFDIPVANLERAVKFYASVLAIKVDVIDEGGFTFAVLEHGEGKVLHSETDT
ncbi:hypothetical protein A9Q98_14500 [Thalassotalea sp. 42_200_T64]|nr:hypothetical protein A9Q98_14500 [Thalassotalea sp. 42_200_T64]